MERFLFGPVLPGDGVPPFVLSALLALKHDPRALPQRDAGRRPARHRRPVGCLCHLEVVDAGDVLPDAVAGVVPDLHAEGEVAPVCGDAPIAGWLDPLQPVLYPSASAKRTAGAAPGCPAFGDDSVLDREARAFLPQEDRFDLACTCRAPAGLRS